MRTQIAVGVIYNKTHDKVLLARRPDDKSQGGLWEFPGGKILPGEGNIRALERELFEELNIRIKSPKPLITVNHDYPELSVTLNVFSISDWNGDMKGNEGQYIEWVPVNTLDRKIFPDANLPIITAVRLPHLYLITPDLEIYDEKFLDDLDRVLQAGVRLLQFRCKHTPAQELKATLNEIRNMCSRYDCLLMINGSLEVTEDLICQGIHMTSAGLLSLKNRPLSENRLIAASCHNLEELDHAGKIGVDFAVLGPVKTTQSHQGGKAMGWEKFQQLARDARIPVYALGGMGVDDLRVARENGGQGIAMISGIWSAKDKVEAVKRVLDEDF